MNYFWYWHRVERGGRVFFFNDIYDMQPHRYHGAGFDSGWVPWGEIREVAGVSALAIGEYGVTLDSNEPGGYLYIDRTYEQMICDAICA